MQATADQVRIQQYALFEQLRIDAARLRSLGATEEQLEKLAAAYRKQAQEAKDTAGEEDAARRKAEEEKIKRAETRKILLVFDADASQVKNQADLASFSLGLLTERIAGLSPAIGSAVQSIEQIVVGVAAGGPAGTASIFSGIAFGIGALMDAFGGGESQAQRYVREMREVEGALKDARDATGALAASYDEFSRARLDEQFDQILVDIGNLARSSAETWSDVWYDALTSGVITDDLRRELESIATYSPAADLNLADLEQVGAQLDRFINGTISNLSDALSDFNTVVALQGVEDPSHQLAILRDSLSGIVDLNGILSQNLSSTSLSDLRNLFPEELNIGERDRILIQIADLQRDIQQAELDARQEQADALIQNIERNKIAILRAIDDAEEAQKRATLRAVGLQFDAREAGIRSQFFGQITGSRTDPLERERVLEDLQREIELLRVQEQAATVAELGRIRVSFDEARQAQEDQVTEQIRAVERATENLGVTFENALGLEIGGMTSTFDQVLHVTRMMQDTSNVQPVVTSVHQLSDVTRMMQDTSNVQPVVTSVHQLSDVTRMMQDTSNVQPVVTLVHQLSDVTRMMQDTSNVQPVVTSVHQLSDVTRMMQDTSNVQPVVTSVHQLSATFDQVLHVTRMMQDTSNVQPVVTSVHQLSEDVTGAINTALDFGPVQVQMELIQRSTDALGADFGTWMTWSTDRIVNAVNNPTWAAAGGGTTVNFGNISLGNSGLSISDVRRMFQRELLPLIINEIIDGKLSARANPTFRFGLGQGISIGTQPA